MFCNCGKEIMQCHTVGLPKRLAVVARQTWGLERPCYLVLPNGDLDVASCHLNVAADTPRIRSPSIV